MAAIEHIFWDLDHTLWDFNTNSILALKEVYHYYELQQKGIPSFEDFNTNYHQHNDRMWDKFRKGLLSREDLRWKRMYLTLMDYKLFDETLAKGMSELYLEYLPQQTHLHKGALEILTYCKAKGYGQHMITNGFEKTQIQKMANSGIQPYIDQLITSEKALSMKPKLEIFEFALAQIGAKASACIMIGDDDEVDVKGALDAGMQAAWFSAGVPSQSKYAAFTAINLEDLRQIL